MNAAVNLVFDLDLFFRFVSKAAQRALMINYDGVVVPLTLRGDKEPGAAAAAELIAVIRETCNTRFTLTTAQRPLEVASVFCTAPFPEILGSNGFECLHPDGSYACTPLESHSICIAEEAFQWLEAEGISQFVERTANGLVIDWTRAAEPEAAEVAAIAHRALWPFERHAEVGLRRFKSRLELCCQDRTADAIGDYLSQLESDAVAAYLGNNFEDEKVFQVIQNRALGVLVSDQFRPTAAHLWLHPPQDLSIFLGRWIVACGRQ